MTSRKFSSIKYFFINFNLIFIFKLSHILDNVNYFFLHFFFFLSIFTFLSNTSPNHPIFYILTVHRKTHIIKSFQNKETNIQMKELENFQCGSCLQQRYRTGYYSYHKRPLLSYVLRLKKRNPNQLAVTPFQIYKKQLLYGEHTNVVQHRAAVLINFSNYGSVRALFRLCE